MFLIEQKVVCLGLVGLALVVHSNLNEGLYFPDFSELLSPVGNLEEGKTINFEKILDPNKENLYSSLTMDIDEFLIGKKQILVFF